MAVLGIKWHFAFQLKMELKWSKQINQQAVIKHPPCALYCFICFQNDEMTPAHETTAI